MADRYWVGGTGTWNSSNTINWSTTSGGTGGASVPTSSDDVYFDLSSGTGTVTFSDSISCNNLNLGSYLAFNFSSSILSISNTAYFGATLMNLQSCTINVFRLNVDGYRDFNAGTSTINVTDLFGGGATFYNVNVNRTLGNNIWGYAATTVGTFNNLTITGECSITGTVTVNGTFSATGIYIYSSVTEVAKQVITNGPVVLSFVNFEDITAGGTSAPWTGTSLGDCGGNSNITFTPAVTRYFVNPTNDSYQPWSLTSSWSNSSGGSSGASVPLPQDTAIINENSGTGGVSLSNITSKILSSIDCTNYSGTIRFTSGQYRVYGNFIIPSSTNVALTSSSTTTVRLVARTNKSIAFVANKGVNLIIDRSSANYTAVDRVGNGGDDNKFSLSVNKGTFNASSYDLSLLKFVLLSGATANMGSSTWYFQGDSASDIWQVSGTLNKQTANIQISTRANVAFYGGGKAYNTITCNDRQGTYSTSFYGNNTIDELAFVNGTGTYTIKFESGSTTNIGKWSVNGTLTKPVYITSTTSSSHTLNYTGTLFVLSNYLNISYSNATPLNTWYANTMSINNGNNSGWYFTYPMQGSLLFGSNF